MNYTIKGTIYKKFNLTKTEKFEKRIFWIKTIDPEYPQIIAFELKGDKTFILNNVEVNDRVEVHFNIDGREWRSTQGEIKCFTSLSAWRIIHEV